MNRSFVLGIGLLGVLLAATTPAAETSNIVVTLDRVASKPVVLLNSQAIGDPLMALSRLHKDGVPDKPVLLLVHPKVTLDEITNMLGVMYKAQTATPRIFVFSEDKSTMKELSIGCPMMFSTNLAKLTPAHGGLGCSK